MGVASDGAGVPNVIAAASPLRWASVDGRCGILSRALTSRDRRQCVLVVCLHPLAGAHAGYFVVDGVLDHALQRMVRDQRSVIELNIGHRGFDWTIRELRGREPSLDFVAFVGVAVGGDDWIHHELRTRTRGSA
jgi:hypothetical protein